MIVILVIMLCQFNGHANGCRPEWVVNEKLKRCYRLPVPGQDERLTWFQARQYCDNIDSELLCLTDIEEQNFIFGAIGTKQYLPEVGRIWLGVSDHIDEGIWRYVKGVGVVNTSFFDWVPVVGRGWIFGGERVKQMNSSTSDRPAISRLNGYDCLQLLMNGRVYDDNCERKEYFICSAPDTGKSETTSETNNINVPTKNSPILNTTKSPVQSQSTKTCALTNIVLACFMTIFIILSLVLLILYIRLRKQSKKPHGGIYDRAIVQTRPEHVYQSYNSSDKTTTSGQIYDTPSYYVGNSTGAKSFVEKGLEDSAYLAVRVDNI